MRLGGLVRRVCIIKTPLGRSFCKQHILQYKYSFRFIPAVSIDCESSSPWWLPLSLSSPCSPSTPTSAFSFLCVYDKQRRKFQTVVVLSQQPLLQLSLGRMARVSHLITEALPGSWAWGRFSGGNSRNLIGWGRQRTVNPLHKGPGARS